MSKLTHEQVQEKLQGLKAQRKEVNNAIGAIRLKHRIEKGGKPKDKKLLAEWNSLHEKKEEFTKQIEKLETQAAELKPRKERETKYDYPADCITPEQKKAFRTKMRAQANAANKPEKTSKKEGKKEKAPKKEAPVEKTSKKEGKKEKAPKKEEKKAGKKEKSQKD
jgi:hypothetical protein